MKKSNGYLRMTTMCMFFFIVMIASMISAAENESQFQLQAQSKNGNIVTLSNVQSVHGIQIGTISKNVGKDTSAREIQRKHFSYTGATTIPLKVGHGFGIGFDLGDIKDDDAVVLDVKTISPSPVNDKNFTVGTVSFYSAEGNKPGYIIEDFRAEDPAYHLAGVWGFQILQQGKIIFSTSFNVVK